MTEAHQAIARQENIAGEGRPPVWRYRGRCICGYETPLRFLRPESARQAIAQVHISDLVHGAR